MSEIEKREEEEEEEEKEKKRYNERKKIFDRDLKENNRRFTIYRVSK